MRPRTVAVVVLVLTALVGVALGAVLLGSGEGTLSEQWTSDTVRDNVRNHHPVGVGPEGETIVAPVLDVPGTGRELTDTSCSLVRLHPDNGSTLWQTGIAAEDCFTHAFTQPLIEDTDGDGDLEAVVASTQDAMLVLDADTGEEEFRVSMPTYGYGRPTVAELPTSSDIGLLVSDIRGTVVAASPNGTTLWRTPLPTAFDRNVTVTDSPAVSDLDGDGATEIAVPTSSGVAVLATDGSVLWTTERSGTYVTVVGDGSGGRQLLFSDIGTVAAVDGATGRTRWNHSPELDIRLEDAADVNGDGTAEAFVGLSNGTAVSMDTDTGERNWKTRVVSGETTVLAPPVLGDVTGDGTPEVIVGSRDGTVAVLDGESGEELGAFEREVQVWTSPTPADIDDDDRAEILVEYGDGRVVALAFES